MENEQVFQADAGIAATSLVRSRSSHRGHDIVKIVSGGIESQNDPDNENTSLLAGHAPRSDTGSDGSVDGEERNNKKWSGDKDFEGRPWWNKPSVFWLLPGFFLYTLAWGGEFVPRLNLILDLICKKHFSDRAMKDKSSHSVTVILGGSNPQCQVPEVQALVSNFTLYGTLIAGILSAITSPIYGSFSDRYGRTKILAICTAGMLFSEVIFIIAATYSESVSVEWVLVGYLFDGICGSFTTVMALIFAYGSDCTSPSKRNVVFGYFHGILFGGIALGPILAGIIVKASGHIITIFYFALGCHCLFSLYLLLVVPDSLSMERQVVAREKKAAKELEDYVVRSWFGTTANYLKGSNFFAPLATLYPTGEGSSSAVRQNLVLLAAVDTTMFGVAMGALSVVILYSELMFGWGTFESTIFVSIVNTCRVVVLLIILPAINRIFRGPRTQPQKNSGSDMLDLSIIRTAIGFDLVGYLGYATVRTGPLFILSGAVGSFGGVGSPTLQAAITKHVPHDLTGQVLGAMGLLHALARVVAPTVFNLIYSMTVGTCPQAVFIGLASMFGLAFVMSWFIRPHVHWDEVDRKGKRPVASTSDEPADLI